MHSSALSKISELLLFDVFGSLCNPKLNHLVWFVQNGLQDAFVRVWRFVRQVRCLIKTYYSVP